VEAVEASLGNGVVPRQFGLDTNLLDVRANAQNEDGSVVAIARDVDAKTTLRTVRVPLALDGGLDQV